MIANCDAFCVRRLYRAVVCCHRRCALQARACVCTSPRARRWRTTPTSRWRGCPSRSSTSTSASSNCTAATRCASRYTNAATADSAATSSATRCRTCTSRWRRSRPPPTVRPPYPTLPPPPPPPPLCPARQRRGSIQCSTGALVFFTLELWVGAGRELCHKA